MTPTQAPRLPAAPTPLVDATGASWPRVRDDMTVEVALSVMAGARVGHLLLCDGDDHGTGLVTRAELTAVRDSSAYTDRMRLRDIRSAPPVHLPSSPLPYSL